MHVKRVALFNEDSFLELLFTKKTIRYDSACRQVCVFVFILEFFTTVDSDNYECICLPGCMSMQSEEVDEYDFMCMHKEGVCVLSLIHI